MKMKKLIALGMATLMVASMVAGCGSSSAEDTSAPADAASEDAAAEDAAAQILRKKETRLRPEKAIRSQWFRK